jgi:hypothetical protein
MLDTLAQSLGTMLDEVVFVGGSVVSLYRDSPDHELFDVRPTYDIDAVIHVESLIEYYDAESKLKKLGFSNCTDEGAPICRYKKDNLIFDLMPDKPEILVFSNQWYSEGMRAPIEITLYSGIKVQILSLPFYLASKLEAYQSRGKNDLIMSHDMEDVFLLLRGLKDFESLIAGPVHLQKYLKNFFRAHIQKEEFIDYIYNECPGTKSGQQFAQKLVSFFRAL